MRRRRAGYQRKGPQAVGDVLAQLLARRGYAAKKQHQIQQELWKDLAGEHLASQSRPGNIKGGILDVFARNSAAIQELSFQKKELLRRLKEAEPTMKIREIRFKIAEFD